MATLYITGIRTQRQGGARGGVRYAVDVAMPDLEYYGDSRILATYIAAHVRDAIADHWRSGRDARGRPITGDRDYRDAWRVVDREALAGASWDAARDALLREVVIPARAAAGGRSVRETRLWRPLGKPGDWARRVYAVVAGHRAYLRVQQGDLPPRRTRAVWVPSTGTPNGYASGLAADTLYGRYRAERTYRDRRTGQRVTVRAHVELRLPPSRQNAGTYVLGLRADAADGDARQAATEVPRVLLAQARSPAAVAAARQWDRVIRGLGAALAGAVRLLWR